MIWEASSWESVPQISSSQEETIHWNFLLTNQLLRYLLFGDDITVDACTEVALHIGGAAE